MCVKVYVFDIFFSIKGKEEEDTMFMTVLMPFLMNARVASCLSILSLISYFGT